MNYKILLHDKQNDQLMAIVYTVEGKITDDCFTLMKFIKYDTRQNVYIYNFVFDRLVKIGDSSCLVYNEKIIQLHDNLSDYLKHCSKNAAMIPYRFKYPAYIGIKAIDGVDTGFRRGVWYSNDGFFHGFASKNDKNVQLDSVKNAKSLFKILKIKKILQNEKI